MNLVVDELNPNTRCVRLSGRLDLKGSGEIDLRFTSLTATDARDILVDMSGVDFLASIGMLLTCAKAKSARGAQMVLFGMQPMVKEALDTAGISSLMPTFADEGSALEGLKA